MDYPISIFVAKALMQRLADIAMPQINPKLWFWYADDTFVIMNQQTVETTRHLLNNIFAGVKFTIEYWK